MTTQAMVAIRNGIASLRIDGAWSAVAVLFGLLALFDRPQFAASLELIAPHPGRMKQYYITLEALVSSMNCYDLWVEQGAELGYASELALSSETVDV